MSVLGSLIVTDSRCGQDVDNRGSYACGVGKGCMKSLSSAQCCFGTKTVNKVY